MAVIFENKQTQGFGQINIQWRELHKKVHNQYQVKMEAI